ncbi:MAG: hypothetical protein ACYDBH_00390 [Acidobacteriaceae bacterium]
MRHDPEPGADINLPVRHQAVMRMFYDTTEEGVRNALIALGWTPPDYGAIPANDLLCMAARRVVDARHHGGDDGWDKLKDAIGKLEDIVGRT